MKSAGNILWELRNDISFADRRMILEKWQLDRKDRYVKEIKKQMPLKSLVRTKKMTEAYAAGLTKAIEIVEQEDSDMNKTTDLKTKCDNFHDMADRNYVSYEIQKKRADKLEVELARWTCKHGNTKLFELQEQAEVHLEQIRQKIVEVKRDLASGFACNLEQATKQLIAVMQGSGVEITEQEDKVMDLKEIREKKKQLERFLLNELKAFSQETGVSVVEVNLHSYILNKIGETEKLMLEGVDVGIEI